jgi:hypothetical protein
MYMFVDSTASNLLGRALLLSPVYGQIAAACKINFWVHKQTDGISRLLLVSGPAIKLDGVL